MTKRFLRATEAAKILDININTIYAWIEEGTRFEVFCPNGEGKKPKLIVKESFEAFINEHTTKTE
jgi:transposase